MVSYFRNRRSGFVDVLIEDYANERDELRYAITPSVVQHVGRTSSKMDDYGPLIKQKVWSFSFEKQEWLDLKNEHEAAAGRKEVD